MIWDIKSRKILVIIFFQIFNNAINTFFDKNPFSLDLSDMVVKQMNHLHHQDRPDLVFEKIDATNMIYNDDNFNVILDKGIVKLIFNFTKKNY